MKRKNKLPFSLTRSGGFYKIRSNKNQEIVSGPISNEKHKAVKVLLNYANTDRFGNFYHGRDTLRNLLKVFNGRLRPKGTAWTLEEARLIAKTIKTRKQLHDSGLFYPENPHDFTPDTDVCTPEEIENHRKACEEWDKCHI